MRRLLSGGLTQLEQPMLSPIVYFARRVIHVIQYLRLGALTTTRMLLSGGMIQLVQPKLSSIMFVSHVLRD